MPWHLLREEAPVGCAEVISLDDVRVRTHWTMLRERLHARFDRWLDQLEAALPEVALTLYTRRVISHHFYATRHSQTVTLPGFS